MVAAGCKVREVSQWAGRNSVAFALARYGGLFEDSADAESTALMHFLTATAPEPYRIGPSSERRRVKERRPMQATV